MAAATLMVPALAGSAEAATTNAAVVGPSACGKKYAAGYWWTYPTTNTKLRSGPGTGYAALGLLHEGDGVEVKCKAKKAGWMRIYVLNGPQDGRTGWVASKYIAD
ncbi:MULTISPECIES: SH3 domain-containing protein [Streptomyces]|uniref:SH3 domain-containing protein n=1 Tax=Streptomyces scabiei TaxID=1930 RepID=UPI001B331CCC|nr:SH3 domain-containing protein [Streptomyces sp. LBUM 1487]